MGSTPPQDFNLWAETFSQMITDETFKLIEGRSRKNLDAIKFVASMFVARFVGTLVFRTLTEPSALRTSKKDQEAFTNKNFLELKMSVQNAVAAGFQNAVSQFSGSTMEYYCLIKPVPEPTSNQVN